jgi:dTDP-4-dehydrorhamnose 3,5-epimerase
MKIETTTIPGLLVLEPRRFKDERGYFFESWQEQRYQEAGIFLSFTQDNVSSSTRGTLRGMHFQNPRAQGKLVSVYAGEVFDVAVDVRCNSASFGHWFGLTLSAENGRQMWIPPGFAHGFLVTSESAIFSYKCTSYYSQENEIGLHWSDPEIAISWPKGVKLLSPKDADAQMLSEIPKQKLVF